MIDGHYVKSGEAALDVPLRGVTLTRERREACRDWCRARGIDLNDEDYTIEEGLLLEGGGVRVREAEELTVLSPAEVTRSSYR